jgi:hypothetical protein
MLENPSKAHRVFLRLVFLALGLLPKHVISRILVVETSQ